LNDIAYIVVGLVIVGGVAVWQLRTRIPESQRHPSAHLYGEGTYDYEVVGEASYQNNISSLCGKPNRDGYNVSLVALLILEDSNPRDSNAVRIDINGVTVGYLSRALARDYREQLAATAQPRALCSCPALIRGGWDRGGSDIGPFGVVLDLPAPARKRKSRNKAPV
jgi:hypothetical protein